MATLKHTLLLAVVQIVSIDSIRFHITKDEKRCFQKTSDKAILAGKYEVFWRATPDFFRNQTKDEANKKAELRSAIDEGWTLTPETMGMHVVVTETWGGEHGGKILDRYYGNKGRFVFSSPEDHFGMEFEVCISANSSCAFVREVLADYSDNLLVSLTFHQSLHSHEPDFGKTDSVGSLLGFKDEPKPQDPDDDEDYFDKLLKELDVDDSDYDWDKQQDKWDEDLKKDFPELSDWEDFKTDAPEVKKEKLSKFTLAEKHLLAVKDEMWKVGQKMNEWQKFDRYYRKMSERLGDRVLTYAVIQCCMLVFLGLFQSWHLKRFFMAKKMV